jgi:hypothetical protein
VPAAAVTQGMQALSGIIGRKAFVDCLISLLLNLLAQPKKSERYCLTMSINRAKGISSEAVKCVDIGRNTGSESALLVYN